LAWVDDCLADGAGAAWGAVAFEGVYSGAAAGGGVLAGTALAWVDQGLASGACWRFCIKRMFG